MKMLLITLAGFMLVACASKPEPGLLRMRSISVPIDLPRSTESNGEIDGLDRLPRDSSGKIRANVLFVHGIGWTQDKSKLDFGRDFIVAIADAYGVKPPEATNPALCPRSSFSNTTSVGAGLRIVDELGTRSFYTDYVPNRSANTHIACVDKQVIDLGDRGSIAVYRILWDDTLYNAYEYPQIGYDDALLVGTDPAPGYEDIDKLRTEKNRELKTSVVTYGLTDAAMYLGPIGSLMRTAISSAFCAAFDDAAGLTTVFAEVSSSKAALELNATLACKNARPGQRPAFSIVAESLGSRAVYDVLTESLSATAGTTSEIRAGALDRLGLTGNNRVEVFLLANQIPLLGVGRLSSEPRIAQLPKPTRLVAISEINDVLTYELVPYFEHLFIEQCRTAKVLPRQPKLDCVDYTPARLAAELASESGRTKLVSSLGFDVVDVRVRFAGPVSAFVPDLISPLDAHTKHMTVPFIRDLIVCGAQKGNARLKQGKSCVQR